jgi:uncharacterized protein (DUF924 family)
MTQSSPPVIAPQAQTLLQFWRDAGPSRWFTKDAAFDADFRQRFESLHQAAARRELDDWQQTPEGTLALLLLLDQLPRNAYRGTAHMYATDPLARRIAHDMIDAGHDQTIPAELRSFCYLPLAHAENLADQERSVALAQPLPNYLPHAIEHRDIVQRFGRFPHRNPLLGRDTTPDEAAYLAEGGFAG